MKKYTYNCSTNTIWCSFDYGEVEANSYEEALIKAKEELKHNIEKANDAFYHCDITKGFTINMDLDHIQVYEIKLNYYSKNKEDS